MNNDTIFDDSGYYGHDCDDAHAARVATLEAQEKASKALDDACLDVEKTQAMVDKAYLRGAGFGTIELLMLANTKAVALRDIAQKSYEAAIKAHNAAVAEVSK